MSTIFDDNFSSYSPGFDPPTGWLENAALHGFVVDFGTMTGSSSATGFYERSGKGYQMGVSGNIVYLTTASPFASTTIVWASFGNPGQNGMPIMTVSNLPSGTNLNNIQDIAWLQTEGDGSVSIRAASTNGSAPASGGFVCANSPTQYTWVDTWHYLQLNLSLTALAVGTTGTFVTLDGTAFVDGTNVATVGAFVTNINVAGLAGPPYGNVIELSGNGWVGDIFASNGIYNGYGTNTTGTQSNYWPHPDYGSGSTGLMNAQVTQGVVEVGRFHTGADLAARMTQAVVEVPWTPGTSSRAVRMTQGVVEIILRSGGQGWVVYEA